MPKNALESARTCSNSDILPRSLPWWGLFHLLQQPALSSLSPPIRRLSPTKIRPRLLALPLLANKAGHLSIPDQPSQKHQTASRPTMADAPRKRSRSRSRSPPRRPKGSSSGGSGGFRWKEKRSLNYDDERGGDRDRGAAAAGGLQRGYRDRSPRRDRDRDGRGGGRARSPRRDRDGPREEGASRRDRSPRRDRDGNNDNDGAPRRDRDGDRNSGASRRPRKDRADGPPARPPPAPAAATAGGMQEEMIIVTVNDRLGTKAQIPAFASDKIKDFKVMVAMKVGREPHEILLKRQGERPFKDQLSLADYGISNGVQIDLEVDTGD